METTWTCLQCGTVLSARDGAVLGLACVSRLEEGQMGVRPHSVRRVPSRRSGARRRASRCLYVVSKR